MNDKVFTVADAIKIQQQQLLQWKSVLKPEKYDLLQQHATEMNKEIIDTVGELSKGYNVFRGQEIDMFIYNTLMKMDK